LVLESPVLLDLFLILLALLFGSGPRGAGYAVLEAFGISISQGLFGREACD
jgi:hypothetical protein